MFETWLFTTNIALARQAEDAGITGIFVDWESLTKGRRQAATDFECNSDTLADLVRVREAVRGKVVCRINSMGPHTQHEVDLAVDAGANLIFLPMVKTNDEVEQFMTMLDGRAQSGVLIETVPAIEQAEAIACLPLDYVYVGLNDLLIARRSANIFVAVADGTVETLAKIFHRPRFGFGGVTVVDAGSPVPCRLLLREMDRLGCEHGFLRRSFKRDIEGLDMKSEVDRISIELENCRARDSHEQDSDKQELCRVIDGLSREPNMLAATH